MVAGAIGKCPAAASLGADYKPCMQCPATRLFANNDLSSPTELERLKNEWLASAPIVSLPNIRLFSCDLVLTQAGDEIRNQADCGRQNRLPLLAPTTAVQDQPMRPSDQPRPACRPIQRSRLRLAAGLAILAAAGSPAFAQTAPAPAPPSATAAARPAAAGSPSAGSPGAGSPGAENPGAGSLADLAAQFEKSADTVVADVNGTPITLGMVADRLHAFPEKFAVLPATLMYKAALDDLIQQRALAVKAKELGLDKTAATTTATRSHRTPASTSRDRSPRATRSMPMQQRTC
jgi:hypothetical protein